MFLRKKPAMTEVKTSVNHANGRGSHGLANPEERKRIRAVHSRRGLLVQAHPRTVVMLSMEDSNFRQVWHIPNLHPKIEPRKRQMEAIEKGDEKHARVSRDIPQNKGVIG